MKITIRLVVQKKWKDDTHIIHPKNTGEKRKDQGNVIIITIITMTMTGIDHIVEIDHETTTEMTIEKKITGGVKFGNIEVDIEIIMETHVMTGT